MPQELSYCITLKWVTLLYISRGVSGSVFSTPRCLLFKANHTAPWLLLPGRMCQPFVIPLAQLWAQPSSPLSSLKHGFQLQTQCPNWGFSSTWWGTDLRTLIQVLWEAGSEATPRRLLLPLPHLGIDALETSPLCFLKMQRLRHQDARLDTYGQQWVLIKRQLTSQASSWVVFWVFFLFSLCSPFCWGTLGFFHVHLVGRHRSPLSRYHASVLPRLVEQALPCLILHVERLFSGIPSVVFFSTLSIFFLLFSSSFTVKICGHSLSQKCLLGKKEDTAA